jgi:hypothetical protein
LYIRSRLVQSFLVIVILTVSVVSLVSMTVSFHTGPDLLNTESIFAQLTNDNTIQITSTSSYIDDFGNFHVIGEVNNTSTDPQTNILVTALLSDTNNNVVVGNHSAFSSIGTLRQGELSPFDIVIQNPQQILGKFNFMEFLTTSQPAVEKPATLLLNGSSSFVDNVGNPHITGNIINQGQSPEQLLNVAMTFYDNSSFGVIGTQSFGLNVGNLANNQMAPFDITITDNKTKSQAAFYSLNVDSVQSSMGFPLNPKFPFATLGGFVDDGGLSLDTTLNANPLPQTVNNFDSNNDQSSSSGSNNDNSDRSDSSTNDLEIDIDIEKDPIVRGNIQTIDVIVADDDTQNRIANADTDVRVFYTTEYDKGDSEQTNSDGIATFEFEIGPNSNPGTFDVTAQVNAPGYNTEAERTTFEVIETPDDSNDTGSQNNSAEIDNNNVTSTDDGQNQSDDDLDCEDIDELNIPVGDEDPNNFDSDNDGIGCETDEGNDDQTNNNEQDGGTTNESSDTNPEQTDGDGDGVSNEQPTEEEITNGNGASENE